MRVLGISGSLRRDSHNTKLLRAAGELAEAEGAEFEVFDGLKAIPPYDRSEEHTSELQSQSKHVCRLLLEKKNSQIRFGLIRGRQVGYLGVLSFHQYTADDDLPACLACIRAAGDAVFTQTKALKGLVIDVRSNGGGEYFFFNELASRLTHRRSLALGTPE